MNYEEYKNHTEKLEAYFKPGKEVRLSRAIVTMMSINYRNAVPRDGDFVTASQLPVIDCIYTNNHGNLMEVSIECPDLDALYVMNATD